MGHVVLKMETSLGPGGGATGIDGTISRPSVLSVGEMGSSRMPVYGCLCACVRIGGDRRGEVR